MYCTEGETYDYKNKINIRNKEGEENKVKEYVNYEKEKKVSNYLMKIRSLLA